MSDVGTPPHHNLYKPHGLVDSINNSNICIATLDPQTGNVFVFISSVGFHRRDAFIRYQKGLRATKQTDIKSQKARKRLNGRTDGRTD